MKKTLLLFSFIIIAFTAQSQPIFNENFEQPSEADSVTSSGNPGWTINTTLFAEGSQSYHSGIAANDASSFTTIKVDFSTATNVILSFAQIAKVSPSDAAIIEVSNDSINWILMDGSLVTYLGSGDFSSGKFTSASYPSAWVMGDDNAVPDNTWWQYELFDISSFAGFSDIWFRFTVQDLDGNGSNGNYGWLIDDFSIDTSSCELISPFVTYNPPFPQGTVTTPGPYLISAEILDLSGILSATINYSINGLAQSPITMVNTSGSTYEGSISGSSGDTICYQIVATDNSGCNNTTTEPPIANCFSITFVVPPIIDIGTGTITNTSTTYPAPYGNWYWGARHQMLITAAEMQAAGATQAVNIMALGFDVVTPGGAPLQNFEIKIGHTNVTDLSGAWIPQSQLSTVHLTPVFNESSGWNMHSFNTPFAWNGTDNIVVETCFNNSSFTNNAVHNQSATAGVYTRWYNSDASGVCANVNVNGTVSQRPNMRLQVVPPQQFDAGVIQIVQPGGTTSAGTSLPVQVVVRNFGLNPINNFDIEYTVNGVVTGSFTVTSAIAPSATATINLPNFTAPVGLFSICAYSNLSNDGYTPNDTTCAQVTGFPVISVNSTSVYYEQFDTGTPIWGAINTSNTQWQLGTPSYGATNTAYSSPNSWDVNLTTAYGANATSYLYSPFFDLSTAVSPVLSFYHNRNSQLNNDGVRVEYSINNGNWFILGGVGSGTNWYNSTNLTSSNMAGWSGSSSGWIKSILNLPSAFNNQSLVQFRFVFTSDGFTGTGSDGFSIDDLEIFVPVSISASTQNLTLTNVLLLPGAPQTALAQIRNKGTTPLQNVNITLAVDGTPVVTDNVPFSPPLPGFPNNIQVYNHIFSQPWIATPGAHTLTVYTTNPNLSSDQNPSDDTTSIIVTVFDSTGTPYCNDFEGSQPQWVTLNALSYSTSTNWQLGTPAQTIINSAYNGNNAWMTKLTSNYGPRDSSGLFSPVFGMLAGQCYKLSFQHHYATELFQDGGTVEYSIDGTATWNALGIYNQPNWYSTQYIAALGSNPPRPGWSGISSGWSLAENNLGFTTSQNVIFRFRFASDMTIHNEGWAIDQFCFEEDPTNQCVLITDINDIPESSGLALDQNYPNPAANSTVISYAIPERGDVVLEITNLLGQQVKVLQSGVQEAGFYSVEIDLAELNSGIYYYSLTFNNSEQMVRKMVIVK